jgi:predicted membrane protein
MIDAIIIGLLILFIIVIMYMFVQDIFLISLIFFIFAYLVYLGLKFYFKKKKKPKVIEQPIKEEKETISKNSKESIELKDYVKYNIHYGQTPKTVRTALEKEGWPKEKIDQAFLDYYAEAKI